MVGVGKKLPGLDHVGAHEKYLLTWRKLLWHKITLLASQSCLLAAAAHVLRGVLLLEKTIEWDPMCRSTHDGPRLRCFFFSSKSPGENETTIVVTLPIWTHLFGSSILIR
jgi:hypothetical protein